MKIKKLNKHLKAISIFLFGIEYVHPTKITLNAITDETLKSLLCEDEFGVYKKDNIKIPFKYRKKYKLYKHWREELIYSRYYHLSITVRYGSCKQYYLFDDIEIPSKSDKIVVEQLLNKG